MEQILGSCVEFAIEHVGKATGRIHVEDLMQTKTLVALYDHLSDARATVDDLVAGGIPREAVNLVANDATRAYEGELSQAIAIRRVTMYRPTMPEPAPRLARYWGAWRALLVGLGAFAIPGVGPIVAAGPIVATLTGAGVGAATGGILGGLTDLGVSENDAHTYAEGVRRGGYPGIGSPR